MLLLLPPSETKRDGGTDEVLDLGALSFPELSDVRAELVDEVVELARDPAEMMRALKLGPRQAAEVARNSVLRRSPTLPAIDRYTGVLFDALDAPSLDGSARAFAGETVVVHSALFGLVGALDPIPAYRLSHDSRLPGGALKRRWRDALSRTLSAYGGVIVDLRSEGYVELGPAPRREGSAFVRVVSEDGTGRRRALNHFNKRAKGLFARAVLEQRPEVETIRDLVDWAASAGFSLDAGPGSDAPAAVSPDGELQLIA